MAICKDCICYESCKDWAEQYEDKEFPYRECHFFKSKADVEEVVRCKDCQYCKESELSMQKTLSKMSLGVEQARAEGIKDFAERLKEKASFRHPLKFVLNEEIEKLVKEMIGEQQRKR